jgi:AraC-like DNA-binding protein
MPDADQRYTIAASALPPLLAYARAHGAQTADILPAVGLDEAAIAAPEARVSQAVAHHVWESVAARLGDDALGLHFAERCDLEAFHVVGHIAAHSPTLGEAFTRLVAYSRILHDSGRVEVERDAAEVRIYPGCRGLPHVWPRHIAEFSAATVVVLGRAITGKSFGALAVAFRHERPARASEHLRIFGVEPLFAQPETVVTLDAASCALPVVDAKTGMRTYLEAYAREILARLPTDDGLSARVRRAVATALPSGIPDADAVASQLGLGARTLQRRLRAEGSTFQALVDDVRREYAEAYLRDPSLSIAEIGFLLGFADPSNFHRAFRRWTGRTPAALREPSRD